MTFQTQLFKAEPTAGDFDPQKLPPPVLQQYISLVNLIIEQSQTEVNVHSSLAARVAQQIGLGIGNEAGVTATVFAAGSNLLELLKKGIESLSAACSEAKLPLGPITRLSFLTHPIPLRPADYPTRHASLIQFAVLAQQDQRTALTMPGARALPDRVASALESLKAPIEAWKSGAVSLVALRPFTIEIQPRDTAPQGRQPMCPGSFYPKSPNEIRSDLEKFLRCDSPTQKRQVRAVVLPHAGWRFCGDIIGKTLRQIEVPDRAIVLGPKHTPHGPNWSISASPAWLYPHTTVPIAPDLRKMLLEKISGLELDNEAHRIEHSIEVLLPFLQHLNPNIKVAPIALGRSSFSSLGSFAEALSEIIHGKDNPPLLVISSDMNHFASEEENQRLDHKALDALKTGDPQTLYSTCTENKISMCGMLPTVAALWALKLLSETLQIELIDYHTSYPISGDSSRVVGYAGVIIE